MENYRKQDLKDVLWVSAALVFAVALGVCLALLSMKRTAHHVAAQTQPVYIPRVNGHGSGTILSNATLKTGARIGTGNITTNPVGVGPFSGDGSGLTNLTGVTTNTSPANFITNTFFYETNFFNTIQVTNNSFFNGKVTLNSNVVVNTLDFQTNQAAVTTLNIGNNYQFVSTNNNVAYTGFTGIKAGETNVQWCTVLLTNSSGSLKTVTFTGVVGDSTVYVTNQSVFTVMRYPRGGTNVVGRSLN